jgi:Fibronectin type III domain
LLAALILAGCGGGGNSGSPSATAAETNAATGTATMSWTAPTMNSDGSPLSALAGFTIYYGTSSASLTQTIQIPNAGAVNYVVTNLSPGTWYFAVSAYTNAGEQSALSTVVSKTI